MQKSKYRILLFDSHRSHITQKVSCFSLTQHTLLQQQQQIVNAVKSAEKLPYLEAECQLNNANIDELNKQKESLVSQFESMLEEVKLARQYRENELRHEQ